LQYNHKKSASIEAGKIGGISVQKRQNSNPLQRFDQYQPSKTALFWGCAGSAVLAIVIGFSWGGWVTGGSAQAMAEKAAAQGRQEVAAVVCVDRFMAAQDAGVQLTALQKITSSYAQSRFVQDGGWAVLGDSTTDDRKAADLCAAELAKREVSPTGEAGQITKTSTAEQ
jgi:pimeloyl-ACP methyl ester carboxylesterase